MEGCWQRKRSRRSVAFRSLCQRRRSGKKLRPGAIALDGGGQEGQFRCDGTIAQFGFLSVETFESYCSILKTQKTKGRAFFRAAFYFRSTLIAGLVFEIQDAVLPALQ